MKDIQTILTKLNDSQRRAVESIQGSFMVVAGPGTGKTQVLSARTAYILSQTDVSPENILITTFTEAGVVAIKKRLHDFIGSASYKVEITTLHGLANTIITNYPDYFVKYRALVQMDELEGFELIEEILESGDYTSLRPLHAPGFWIREIATALQKLREEGIFPADFLMHIEEFMEEQAEELGAINPKLKKYENTKKSQEALIIKYRELARIAAEYDLRKKQSGKYDFSDMILHVVQELEANEMLAAELAEKFQYIMIDEFQDLSNSQSRLVEGLLRMSDAPNIMTVGDDDQSIYRFQGANLENMLHFSTKFPTTKFIVLSTNYRSGQEVLNAASSLISKNNTRLAALIGTLEKPLMSGLERASRVEVQGFTSAEAEKTSIIKKIQECLSAGIPPREIALITRTNAQVAQWSNLLETNGIPIQSRAKGNLFDSEEFRFIALLFRIASDVKIQSVDIIEFIRIGIVLSDTLGLYRLVRNFEDFKRKNGLKTEFFEALFMEDMLEDAVGAHMEDWKRLRECILRLRGAELSHPISALQFFDQELGLRKFIQSKKGLAGLERLYTIFDFISTGYGIGRFSDVPSILRYWRRMQQFNVPFTHGEFRPEPGIQIMTAHQSKGLEYDVVLIPELIDGSWGNKRQMEKLSLPASITGKKITKDTLNEEERRLFFVAITRAKKELWISFPESLNNKAVVMSEFLPDLENQIIQNALIAQPELLLVTRDSTLFGITFQEEEKKFLEVLLREYRLGPTDLSKFLASPEGFLQTVLLRYPFEDTPKTLFGTCYHAALEDFYIQWKAGKHLPSLEFLQEKFTRKIMVQPLSKEFKIDAVERGKKGLEGFYKGLDPNTSLPVGLEYNAGKLLLEFEGIPLKGKIDRIDEITPGVLRVIDYKTGTPKTENALRGNTQAGDASYYHQLLFYKLLIDQDPTWNGAKVETLTVWFVEGKEEKYPMVDFHPSDEDFTEFTQLLHTVWNQISSPDWWFEYLNSKKLTQIESIQE